MSVICHKNSHCLCDKRTFRQLSRPDGSPRIARTSSETCDSTTHRQAVRNERRCRPTWPSIIHSNMLRAPHHKQPRTSSSIHRATLRVLCRVILLPHKCHTGTMALRPRILPPHMVAMAAEQLQALAQVWESVDRWASKEDFGPDGWLHSGLRDMRASLHCWKS
jgi:hypothetical protein